MSPDPATGATARRLVVLTPIAPAPTGNGLSMRAELFRRSGPGDADVLTVVVPVAGRPPDVSATAAAVVAPDPALARRGTLALASGPVWRERFARVSPLPPMARAASPGLADAVIERIADPQPFGLHVMRAYLAPLAVAVAERQRAIWMTLDLDEDDAAFARSRGDFDGATAYERLLDEFAPLFDGLSAASAREAADMGERHGVSVTHIPNAIASHGLPSPALRKDGPDFPTLLFVGNLTYPPNVEAVEALAGSILPAVRRRLGRRVRLTVVGPHDGRLDRLRGGDIEVTGYVPDLGPLYASADAVVVPLRSGGGTRIKVIEAFAYGVPVVATSLAAAGLDVINGRHLLLVDDDDDLAAAVATVLTDDGIAARLVDHAARLARESYDVEAVTWAIRAFFDHAAAHAAARQRP